MGVVPLAAALLGAIATVLATRYFGSDPTADPIYKLLADPKLAPADRVRILQMLDVRDDRFWGVVRTVAMFLGVALVWIAGDFGAWLRRR